VLQDNAIRKLDLRTSTMTVLAGTPGTSGTTDGTLTGALFGTPVAMAMHPTQSLLYVTVRIPLHTFLVTNTAGQQAEAPPPAVTGQCCHSSTPFVSVHGVSTSWLQDSSGPSSLGRLRKLDLTAGTTSTVRSDLRNPYGITIDPDNLQLYVAERVSGTAAEYMCMLSAMHMRLQLYHELSLAALGLPCALMA
jgi:hypothetical protein